MSPCNPGQASAKCADSAASRDPPGARPSSSARAGSVSGFRLAPLIRKSLAPLAGGGAATGRAARPSGSRGANPAISPSVASALTSAASSVSGASRPATTDDHPSREKCDQSIQRSRGLKLRLIWRDEV